MMFFWGGGAYSDYSLNLLIRPDQPDPNVCHGGGGKVHGYPSITSSSLPGVGACLPAAHSVLRAGSPLLLPAPHTASPPPSPGSSTACLRLRSVPPRLSPAVPVSLPVPVVVVWIMRCPSPR